MAGKIKKLAEKIANPGDLVKANIYSSPIKNIGKVMQIEIAKKIAGKPKKMELGGEATSNPPSKKSLTDKARDIIEKNSSYNSSFNKVADMLTKKGFTGAAGEKGKVSATERRKKLNRDIFKGGQSKQVPQGMRVGGEATKPLVGGQKKLDKNKDGKISGDDFAMMEDGGEANNKKNKSQSFNQSKGIYGIKNWKENTKNSREKLNSDRIARGDKRNPVKALARMIDDEFEVSDPSMYDEIHIDGAVYSSKNRTPEKSYKPQNPKKVGPKKMEMGGKVEEYGHGGSVKGGGMSCRGMGAAIKGGGFKIR